jgi:hypothetical protein
LFNSATQFTHDVDEVMKLKMRRMRRVPRDRSRFAHTTAHSISVLCFNVHKRGRAHQVLPAPMSISLSHSEAADETNAAAEFDDFKHAPKLPLSTRSVQVGQSDTYEPGTHERFVMTIRRPATSGLRYYVFHLGRCSNRARASGHASDTRRCTSQNNPLKWLRTAAGSQSVRTSTHVGRADTAERTRACSQRGPSYELFPGMRVVSPQTTPIVEAAALASRKGSDDELA